MTALAAESCAGPKFATPPADREPVEPHTRLSPGGARSLEEEVLHDGRLGWN
jgi:hypothetical protein